MKFRLEEMATIGSFMQKKGDTQNKTGFKVFVTNDERPLAHIHLVKRDGKKKLVCVDYANPPKYFIHDKYRDILDNREKEEFNLFLKSSYKYPQTFEMGDIKFKVGTYWEYCVYQWKLENDDSIDNLELATDKDGYVIFPIQPDYTKLP